MPTRASQEPRPFHTLALLAALLACAAPVSGQLTFNDASVHAGVDAVHAPAAAFGVSALNVEAMIGGGAAADFDGDGWTDIFMLTSGGGPDRLFINNRDGTFTDRAAAAGLADPHMGIGAAAGDYDGDGDIDIFVTSIGTPPGAPVTGGHRLYRNNGDGTFTDVAAAAGVSTTSTTIPDGFSSVFADYDADGDLDLFVTGWIGGASGNVLFRNEGGVFTDVTALEGLAPALAGCRAFTPRFVDMDGDTIVDLLIAADFSTSRYFAGTAAGAFEDRTRWNGTGFDDNGMGAAIADFNGDGRLDWYVTSIHTTSSPGPHVPGTGNMLYMGRGGHYFVEESVSRGVNDGGWGWGAIAEDLDNDGDCDLLETNGWPGVNSDGGPEWINDPCYLFLNTGAGGFVEAADACGFRHTLQGRGMITLDYDRDGDLDVGVFAYRGRFTLMRNDLLGPQTRWLRIRLDTAAHACLAPDGIGARIAVTAGGRTMLRAIDGGPSYLATSEPIAHFGLAGAASADIVEVRWPGGEVTVLRDVAADQVLTIPAVFTGDVDRDGVIGAADLAVLIDAFGSADPAADLNGDGRVDGADLSLLIDRFDTSCAG